MLLEIREKIQLNKLTYKLFIHLQQKIKNESKLILTNVTGQILIKNHNKIFIHRKNDEIWGLKFSTKFSQKKLKRKSYQN